MATQTVHEMIQTALGAEVVTPLADESEQDYNLRLKRALDALDEPDFDKLPEPAQEWSNDATNAVEAKRPIQVIPGGPFDSKEQADAEHEAPSKNGHDKTASATPAAKGKKVGSAKTKSGDTAKETPAATAKGTKTKTSPETKETKKDAPTATASAPAQGRRVRTDGDRGVLYYLTVEMHADPKASAAQIRERVLKKNPHMEVKEANAIGIRQQYRRFASFFNEIGAFKQNIALN